jgi:hypothetical protein
MGGPQEQTTNDSLCANEFVFQAGTFLPKQAISRLEM